MKPYVVKDFPPKNINWTELVPFIGKANRAVARFEGVVQSILNPELLLAPLAAREAVLSSKIEGTQASLEEVYLFEAGIEYHKEKQADIQEVINYRNALNFAICSIETKPLCLNTI